jgi:putative oxidoreductase
MSKLTSVTSRWTPRLLGILRIVASLLFMAHGSQKLFLYPPGQMTEPFPIFTLMGIGGILEFFGGLLLLIGLFTRPVAFILSGQMAVAYFRFHAPQGFWPVINRGELAILYCFLFLYLIWAGGGAWSIDGFLSKNKSNKISG